MMKRNASEFRAMARNVLSGRYWWAVLAYLIAALLGGARSFGNVYYSFNLYDFSDTRDWFSDWAAGTPSLTSAMSAFGVSLGVFGVLAAVALLFVGAAMELGYDCYHVAYYKSAAAPSLSTLFSRFSMFWRAVGLRLLMLLKILLWTLLFVVPGIVAAYRYALAPYLMADHPELSASEAIARSKQLMDGHKGRLFCLHLSFIGWILLSVLTAGVGLIFLAPYIKTAETGFYMERTGQIPDPVYASAAAAPTGSEASANGTTELI